MMKKHRVIMSAGHEVHKGEHEAEHEMGLKRHAKLAARGISETPHGQ